MNHPSPLVIDPPELSDEAASQILDLIYQLANAFENHYAFQLRRYYEPTPPPQYDLFDYLADGPLDF